MNRILITGASRGIGRAIAEQLSGPETEIIIHGRDQSALEKLADKIISSGGKSKIIAADLSNLDGVHQIVDQIGDAPINVLVNNAGVAYVAPVNEITLEDWNTSLAINATAPFLLTQKLLPRMPEGASIVNILSIASKTGYPGWGSYCASKFAIEGFSQSLREELRPRKIKVINIYPAATATDIWTNIPGDWNKDSMMKPEAIGKAVKFALDQEASDMVEDITIGGVGGNQ